MRSFWEPVHKKNKRHKMLCANLARNTTSTSQELTGVKSYLYFSSRFNTQSQRSSVSPFFLHASNMRIFFKALQIRLLMIFHLADIC